MAGRSLESELEVWRKHAQIFVRLAHQTISSSATQQTQMHEHLELAQNTMTRYFCVYV